MEQAEAAPTEQPAAVESAAPEQAPSEAPAAVESANLIGSTQEPVAAESPESSFLDSFSEEYRNDPNIAKHKSFDSMAKSLISAQQMLGKKGIVKPGEDADETAWNDYYTQIGRPTEANMYKYEPIEGAPEVSDDDMAQYQEFAYNHGYTQEQYQAGIEFQYEIQQQAQAQLEQERLQESQQTKADLVQEWGEYDFEPNLQAANQAAQTLKIADLLIDNGLAGNKEVIKTLYEVSKSLGSSKIVGEHKVSAGNFEDQLAALKSSPYYNDKMNPDKSGAIQKQIDDLYKNHYPKLK